MKNPFGILALSLVLVLSLSACQKAEQPKAEPSMPGMEMSEQAKNGFDWQLESPKQPYQPGKSMTLSWTIQDRGTGKPVQSFDEVNTKLSHLVIVSRDLTFFEHIHPETTGPGHMSVQTTLPKAGQYEMFLQFAPKGQEEATVNRPLQVGQEQTALAQLVPDADQPKVVDGYTFRLQSAPQKANQMAMPKLLIEKNGKPVTNIEPYLGAGGHAVILSQDAKSFLHVHPVSTPVNSRYQSPLIFHTSIPEPGLYKMWIQSQIAGQVKTIDFTFEVK